MIKRTTIHIVTHAECLDGVAAAWVVKDFYGQREDCDVFIHDQYYHKPLPEFPEGTNVVMVDFCPNDIDELKTLLPRVASLRVLDHHPKSEAMLQEMRRWALEQGLIAKFDYAFSSKKSGALLAWDYFRTGIVPELIEYVSDYDLFQFWLPHSEEVAAALNMFGMSTDAFAECIKERVDSLKSMGWTLLRAQRQHIDWTIQHTRCVLNAHQTVDGVVKEVYLLAVNGNNFIKNEVCARLEQCYPGFAGYVCYWDLTGGQERRYCVRSQKGNAQAIAMCYGGQGHVNAAGFVLPRDSYLEVVDTAEPERPCPPC